MSSQGYDGVGDHGVSGDRIVALVGIAMALILVLANLAAEAANRFGAKLDAGGVARDHCGGRAGLCGLRALNAVPYLT